jgi:hypothetical protein
MIIKQLSGAAGDVLHTLFFRGALDALANALKPGGLLWRYR